VRRLTYNASARRNLSEIQAYIWQQRGRRATGEAFASSLRQQCRKLSSLPGTLGRPRPDIVPGLRSFPFKGYIIFFRYLPDTFEVVNILEGHRDQPAYFTENPPQPAPDD
jgi:toxin ParE1/3/4